MILITGATGTVGRAVVKRLSAEGVPVRAVTRDLRRAPTDPLPHVQFVQGDFDDLESMRRTCVGVDRAFQRSGVRHIVKLSQLHADANSAERFLRYHGVVEAAIRASGLTFTFLRPNLYMQGLLNFQQSIRHKSAFFAAAGGARISAVDVSDSRASLASRSRSPPAKTTSSGSRPAAKT